MLVPGLEFNVLEVAPALGIRRFAEHDHGHVRPLREVCIGAKFGGSTAGVQCLGQAGVDRCSEREIRVVIVVALPREGPAAALHANGVGTRTGHEDTGSGAQRQDAALVLEQHERLAHGLACQRTMFR